VKYAWIDSQRTQYPLERLCEAVEVSVSAFHRDRQSPEAPRTFANRNLLGLIRARHAESDGAYGAPRIHRDLLEEGQPCGLQRVQRLMRRHGIRSCIKRRYKATTDSRHAHPIAPNLLNRQFAVAAPNRAWVADITYIRTAEGWLYLAAVLDLYSRALIGWAMSERINRELVMHALTRAIQNRKPAPGLIHHSDRGSQYASGDFQKLLKDHHIVPSMSGAGNCYDNAVMESFFHSLKTERVHHRRYATRAEARSDLFHYIEVFDNRRRRHSSIGYQSPLGFERKMALAA
jgi:putative transposase